MIDFDEEIALEDKPIWSTPNFTAIKGMYDFSKET